jgi:hypothetical protein
LLDLGIFFIVTTLILGLQLRLKHEGEHVRNCFEIQTHSKNYIGECKEVNLNILKWIPFLELELCNTLNFWDKCANKNLVQISPSINHCKGPKAYVSKVDSYFSFGDLKLASSQKND